jgi:hypothetical protein
VRDTGSTWTTNGQLSIGTLYDPDGNHARLSIFTGGVVNSGSGRVGGPYDNPSFVSISGAGSAWNNTTELRVDQGELSLGGGAHATAQFCRVGYYDGKAASVRLADPGTTLSADPSRSAASTVLPSARALARSASTPAPPATPGDSSKSRTAARPTSSAGPSLANFSRTTHRPPGRGVINFASGTIKLDFNTPLPRGHRPCQGDGRHLPRLFWA